MDQLDNLFKKLNDHAVTSRDDQSDWIDLSGKLAYKEFYKFTFTRFNIYYSLCLVVTFFASMGAVLYHVWRDVPENAMISKTTIVLDRGFNEHKSFIMPDTLYISANSVEISHDHVKLIYRRDSSYGNQKDHGKDTSQIFQKNDKNKSMAKENNVPERRSHLNSSEDRNKHNVQTPKRKGTMVGQIYKTFLPHSNRETSLKEQKNLRVVSSNSGSHSLDSGSNAALLMHATSLSDNDTAGPSKKKSVYVKKMKTVYVVRKDTIYSYDSVKVNSKNRKSKEK
jgi:hypothetical protein